MSGNTTEKPLTLRPAFLPALSAIWLFTWKSQLSWRRLPVGILALLVLPVLVYVTILTPEAWTQRHSSLGNPNEQLAGFTRRLVRSGPPMQPGQSAQLLLIFTEEFAAAEKGLRETLSSQNSANQQSEQIKACYDRIEHRAQAVLDERQFAQFQSFEKRKLMESERRTGQPRWSRTEPFYHWLIDFYFFIILPLMCVRACGALIRDELQADTLCFLTTRPLSRARLLVMKFLSQTAWLQVVALVEGLLLFAAGGLRQIPALGALLPLFLAAQFLAVLAWGALGTYMGQLTKRYIAFSMIYGLVVEMGIGRIPTNTNTLSVMRHLKSLLAQNAALQGLYEWTGQSVPLAVAALTLATVIFLGVAVMLFNFREYHHTEEMQK